MGKVEQGFAIQHGLLPSNHCLGTPTLLESQKVMVILIYLKEESPSLHVVLPIVVVISPINVLVWPIQEQVWQNQEPLSFFEQNNEP